MAAHCAAQCAQWQIPCTIKTVNVNKTAGQSVEAAARTARYAALSEMLDMNAVVCTAHHQDDQAETLLLQLIRGAGVAGLAAMPMHSTLGNGSLLRPLLTCTRAELKNICELSIN